MKVESARIENFKRIRLVELRPEGELVVVGGRNGQGKSSVLDALASALSGHRTDAPIPVRIGEDRATIEVTTDDGLKIRQYYGAGGTYGLKVTNAEGMEAAKPADFLGRFYSKLTFDPLAFARMRPQEQGEALRALLGLDFREADEQRRRLFDARTGINRDVRDLEGEAAGWPDVSALPAEEESLADLAAEHRAASAQLRANGDYRQRAMAAGRTVAAVQAEVADAERRLKDGREKLAKAMRAQAEADAAVLELDDDPDLAAIEARIANAERMNAQIRKAREIRDKSEQLEARRNESRALTESIEAIDRRKREAIAAAAMPVPDLAFSDDGAVLYRGVPFEQSSQSEQIRVSAAVGLAQNPKLRVLLIRDGSLLDDDALTALAALAEEHDAQVFIERVGAAGAQVVLEDGAVAREPGDPSPWDEGE